MNEVGTEVIEKTTAQPSDQSTAKQPEVEKVAAQVQHTTREENPKNALTQLANRNKVKPEISDSIESEEARRAREVLGKIVQGVKDWKPFEEEHDIKLDDDLEHLVEEGDMYSLLRLKSENYREIEMHTTYSYRDRSYRSSKTTEIGKKTELAERDSEIKSDLRNSLQRRVRIKAAILRVVKMKNSDYREDDIYTYIDEKNEKRQNMWFGDISRQELLESAIDLALSVDANIPNSLELCKIAESLGIGESILKFLVGSREDFFLKLVTKVLDEPFKELPNYIKGFMARNINSAKLIDLASALSEEKVSTQQLFKSLTENLSNGELPGIFPERLKEFLILGENPNIARYVRSGVFEMEGLLKRIVSRKDFMGYAKTFDLIIGRGDDAKLCFEYARLSDSLSRGRFTWDEFPEIQGEIPGLPDHLQWRNMSIASRRRFLSDGGTKTDDQIREMDKIEPKNFSEKGRLILIRAILTEVISKSKNSRVKQNADNAIKANTLAAKSNENVLKSNKQMQELVNAMARINKSAEQVKKIVKVIDDIAFQTNLLALNANIEAARAGKFGKGFAVVAEEVRNLAVKSAQSVQETTSMVDDAIKNIKEGNVLVDLTADQLNEISENASKVAELVSEISIASNEQTTGLNQINIGLLQIDQVTQTNTASAEESASAALELLNQANELKNVVNKFNLDNKEENAVNKKINNKLLQ